FPTDKSTLMKSIAILAFPLWLVATLAWADATADRLDNWPHWRGPLATGTAPKGDPPIKWDEKTNVKWKVAIPGLSISTPMVWGARIFALTAIDTKRVAEAGALPKPDPRFRTRTQPPTTYHQFVVLCLDRPTGNIRWQQVATEQVPHEGRHQTNTYASGSPMTDGRYLYVSFGSRGLYCYDLDGKLQWKRDLGLMHTRLGWGEANTPVIHNDTLIANWDQELGSFIVAMDARTDQTKWQGERDKLTS